MKLCIPLEKKILGLAIGEGSFKTTKDVYYLGYGEFENLCFVSVVQTVWVSRAFVYSAVDVNKIMMIFFSKTTFIHICAINYSAKTIAYFICQSLVNILSQIPTV